MREIKFRGKRIDNGKWVYGMPYSFKRLICNIPYYDRPSILMFNPEWDLEAQTNYLRDPKNFAHLENSIWKVIPESVGQYIGQKDKNSKETYKGDIIRYTIPEDIPKDEREIRIVIWDKDMCAFQARTLDSKFQCFFHSEQFEIIGNLTDNPELVESDTKK